MQDVVLLIVFTIIDYAVVAMVVGIAFFTLMGNRKFITSTKITLLFLFIIFGFIDCYALPFMALLDITVTISNQQIANFFNLKPNMELGELFNLDLLDVLTWFVQATIGHFVGSRVYSNRIGGCLIHKG